MFFHRGEELVPVMRSVPATTGVLRASLEALLRRRRVDLDRRYVGETLSQALGVGVVVAEAIDVWSRE